MLFSANPGCNIRKKTAAVQSHTPPSHKYCGSKNELISDVFSWSPTHKHASIGYKQGFTYISSVRTLVANRIGLDHERERENSVLSRLNVNDDDDDDDDGQKIWDKIKAKRNKKETKGKETPSLWFKECQVDTYRASRTHARFQINQIIGTHLTRLFARIIMVDANLREPNEIVR